MPHVFVYGTLLSSKIVQQLTGRVFETVPAILHGFKRHKINGCDYPAIIPNRYAKVGGLLLINVDEQSLNVLTFFEGNEYQAEMVN
jgi:gamma-glutamylcyclotransferase (GGCT)/AIG2-like uncharacterized protein YtfP